MKPVIPTVRDILLKSPLERSFIGKSQTKLQKELDKVAELATKSESFQATTTAVPSPLFGRVSHRGASHDPGALEEFVTSVWEGIRQEFEAEIEIEMNGAGLRGDARTAYRQLALVERMASINLDLLFDQLCNSLEDSIIKQKLQKEFGDPHKKIRVFYEIRGALEALALESAKECFTTISEFTHLTHQNVNTEEVLNIYRERLYSLGNSLNQKILQVCKTSREPLGSQDLFVKKIGFDTDKELDFSSFIHSLTSQGIDERVQKQVLILKKSIEKSSVATKERFENLHQLQKEIEGQPREHLPPFFQQLMRSHQAIREGQESLQTATDQFEQELTQFQNEIEQMEQSLENRALTKDVADESLRIEETPFYQNLQKWMPNEYDSFKQLKEETLKLQRELRGLEDSPERAQEISRRLREIRQEVSGIKREIEGKLDNWKSDLAELQRLFSEGKFIEASAQIDLLRMHELSDESLIMQAADALLERNRLLALREDSVFLDFAPGEDDLSDKSLADYRKKTIASLDSFLNRE